MKNYVTGAVNASRGVVEGALQLIDGKARVVSDIYCDGLGACIGECPTGALKIIEREAVPFNEGAVEQHLAEKGLPTLPCGCPSTNIQTLETFTSCQEANRPADIVESGGESSLTHWPVQIRLVPASAPFSQGLRSSYTCRLHGRRLSHPSPGSAERESSHDGMSEIR